MSDNDKILSKYFGDSSQLTNWILDSGATRHMIPQVLYCIPVSLEYTEKHIEVTDGHHVTAGGKGQVRIKMGDNNGNILIVTLYNVLLAPYLCDRLFSIITLMNLGHTCLFHKGFFKVYFGNKEKIHLLYHIVQSGNMPY